MKSVFLAALLLATYLSFAQEKKKDQLQKTLFRLPKTLPKH